MRLHQVSAITILKLERSARHLTIPPPLLPRSYFWIQEWCYHCAAIQTLGQCPDTAVLQRKSLPLSQTFQVLPHAFVTDQKLNSLMEQSFCIFCFVFKGNYNLIKHTGFVPSVMWLSLPLSGRLATKALSSFLNVLCGTLSCHPTANLITTCRPSGESFCVVSRRTELTHEVVTALTENVCTPIYKIYLKTNTLATKNTYLHPCVSFELITEPKWN